VLRLNLCWRSTQPAFLWSLALATTSPVVWSGQPTLRKDAKKVWRKTCHGATKVILLRKDNSLVFVPCAHCDKECDISKWTLSHLQLGWRLCDDPLSTECAKDRSDLMFNLPLCPLSLDKVQSRVHHCINASTFVLALFSALLVIEDSWLHCNTLEVHTCGAVEGTLGRH